jgi:hypothetical protein
VAELTASQVTALRALAGQAEGYLAQPNAACFHVLGLTDPEEVENDLQALARKRPALTDLLQTDYVIEEVVGYDEDGKPLIEERASSDVGWVITPEGREAIGVE